MLPQYKSVPKTLKNHGCCRFPSLGQHVYPIQSEDNSYLDSQQRQKVELFVFTKLEEYSKKKSLNLVRLTSISRLRRRLQRDIKSFSASFHPNLVSEQKLFQWIDEILDQIQSNLSQFQSLLQSQDDLEHFLTTDELFSSKNINNQWKQIQLQQAKKVLSDHSNDNDEEILLRYENDILERLTPKKLENNRIEFINKEKINLDEEYQKAEIIGRDYLTNMFENFKQRRYPNLQLIQEMIRLGMEQMIKRPKIDRFSQVSKSLNLLTKATFILKTKQSYEMSLQNVADDFTLLRFGHSLDRRGNTADSINNRFISLIHMFLNTISLLIYLLNTNSSESFSPSSLFAPFHSPLPEENLLSPMIYIDQWTWLLRKWKHALEIFPIHLTNHGAFSRLVRTTIGIGISRLYSFATHNEQNQLDEKFFQALQMGFYYGIAYALVDGFQDNQNDHSQQINIDQWLEKIEGTLCGDQLDSSSLPQLPITPLLLETFYSLIQLTSIDSITEPTFTDLALLLRSQRSDKKDLNKSDYTDIDLFLGPLLKSHFTYTATAFLGGGETIQNHHRAWLMPFLGQLTDDCRDFHEDRQAKSITPVTYYAQHHGASLNPFFVFLFVCEDLYLETHREKNTGAFLGRRIMRTLRTLGDHFKEFLTIFASTSYPDLYKYTLSLQHLFHRINDPDKTIFRYVDIFARNYSLNHRTFETFAYDYLPLIEKQLSINTVDNNNPLIDGMNHSLKAGGKRLRPLLLLMVIQLYHINIKRLLPLARAIEYLHTSSLILDDLPAQDNAPLRRGQPTLHMTIDSDQNDIPPSLTEGRAQLAAVDLIAYAIQLVTVGLYQEGFSYQSINRVTAELAQSMNQLCYGQFLDLQAARTKKSLSIDQLDQIAYLKTGKAIEVVLICPVILAEQEQSIDHLRELGRLLGILFQMKDDLLDVEGNTNELGKEIYMDQQNQTVTYLSLLGIEGTQKRIEIIRKQAESILDYLWPQAGTIRDVIRHICERRK